MRSNRLYTILILFVLLLIFYTYKIHTNKNQCSQACYPKIDTIELHQNICINCLGISNCYLLLEYTSCNANADSVIFFSIDDSIVNAIMDYYVIVDNVYYYKYKSNINNCRGKSINTIIKTNPKLFNINKIKLYSTKFILIDSFILKNVPTYKYYLDEKLITKNDSITMNKSMPIIDINSYLRNERIFDSIFNANKQK